MEKANVPYSEWLDWIKVLTARYVKSEIVKEPKKIRYLSLFSFIIGISVIIMGLNKSDFSDASFSERFDFILIFLGILNIILGLMNYFFNYKMYKWITENSSWEERFAVKSSDKHQLQYLLMYVVLILISLGITCLCCC